MTRTISLTKGQRALVDAADYARLSPLKWCFNSSGYAVHYEGRKMIFMHRLIMNAPPGLQVDHINHNRLDNRRANLRFATRSQNQANKGRQVNNTSGYKGVSLRAGKWEARLRVAGKRLHLGRYDDPLTAALVYDAAARLHYADFAGLNFPQRPTSPEIERLLVRLPRKKALPDPGRVSIFKGVVWTGRHWRARIRIDGTRRDLGCFESEMAAADAYTKAAMQRSLLKSPPAGVQEPLRDSATGQDAPPGILRPCSPQKAACESGKGIQDDEQLPGADNS